MSRPLAGERIDDPAREIQRENELGLLRAEVLRCRREVDELRGELRREQDEALQAFSLRLDRATRDRRSVDELAPRVVEALNGAAAGGRLAYAARIRLVIAAVSAWALDTAARS